MKNHAIAAIVIIGLVISGCAAPTVTTATSALGEPSQPTATQEAAETATEEPTAGPTATVWPPVYDVNTLGDIRDQDSFVVTVKEQNVSPDGSFGRTLTMGYIKEPYAAYFINEYSSGVEKTYFVDGLMFTLTGPGDWYIETRKISLLDQANLPEANTEVLADAVFVGEEEYEGRAAYHFVLESVTMGSDQFEGDFYLAKDGNYVLYSNWKSWRSDNDYIQLTTTFSSVNQLSEITLPAEMQDMPAAADVPSELALPLPPESSFLSMIRYQSQLNVDRYWFSNPFASEDEFLDFYRNLPETDGWTVSHIGYVTKHGTDCAVGDVSHECVIINNGSTQVVLAIDPLSENSLRAEFDWNHIFAPIQ